VSRTRAQHLARPPGRLAPPERAVAEGSLDRRRSTNAGRPWTVLRGGDREQVRLLLGDDAGRTSDGPELRYYPPCSTGPGDKTYTFAIHALSAHPTFAVPASEVDGPTLASAIGPLTLATREIAVTYARTGP
jgi:hypothetical protein